MGEMERRCKRCKKMRNCYTEYYYFEPNECVYCVDEKDKKKEAIPKSRR